MRCQKFLFILMMIYVSLSSAFCYAENANRQDPVGLLRYIADNMIAGLKQNKATLKSNPQSVYKLAFRYVVPYADLAEMSRRVLPPQIWNAASAQQRSQFQKEFTTTLMRTYASALTSYENQTIQIYPIRGAYQNKSTVEVSSVISGSNIQPLQVTYRLVHRDNAWRLYDMSVEGVSMLESFRSQFADILASGSMTELLHRMSQHNARS